MQKKKPLFRAASFLSALETKVGTTMAQNGGEHWFSNVATQTANGSGRPRAFGLASAFVVGWLLTGPLFRFSDTWQLVMNTLSSIVTFLMVFLIQNTQNRESAALQLKLDELIRANEMARNSMINLEEMSEIDVQRMKTTFAALASVETASLSMRAAVE